MNVYDFDKTIYRGDSTKDFYFFLLRRHPVLIRYLPKQIMGFLRHLSGKYTKTEWKEAFFSFLAGDSRLRARGRAILGQERAQNRRLVPETEAVRRCRRLRFAGISSRGNLPQT